HMIGYALREQKKLDEAVAALRTVVELDPSNSPAYYGLGNVLYAQKKPEEGARYLRLGLEHDNDLKQLLAQDSKPEPTAQTYNCMAYNAPRLLLVDDTDNYHRLCARMIGEFGDTEVPHTACLIARICALAPDSGPDPVRLVQLAGRAVRAQPVPYYL